MKKEIQSSKTNRTMESKSVPKRMQTILSAITEFVVDLVDDDEDIIRKALADRQDDLVGILKANMPVQKPTSGKKVKDPDAPKRGKSSYIYFCVEKRESIKTTNPEMNAKEIIKELGRVWREDVSDKDKTRYTKMSTADKERYQSEMKDYVTPPGVGDLIEKKGKTKRSGPKRGLTAYIFFCTEHRAVLKEEQPDLSTKLVTAELGKCWKELSEKDRKPFDKLAAKDKARYENEKLTWVDTDGSSKKGKAATTKGNSKKSRSKSGYILYCKEVRPTMTDNNVDWTSQKVTKELGRTWKELSDEEQASFNERATNSSDEPIKKQTTKKSVVKKQSTKKSVVKKQSTKKGKTKAEPESDLEELLDESSGDSDSD